MTTGADRPGAPAPSAGQFPTAAGRSPTAILHVDMDAFFCAVEVLDAPALAGRPLVVGGIGPRGVVASASYEARAFGVRSAMPSSQARRLCPHAVFIQGRYERYAAMSTALHEIFRRFTPLVEGVALDEAFLDVTGARRLLGAAPALAEEIRGVIAEELCLSASVGVARNKLLAKLASEAAKPRATLAGVRPGPGVVVVEPGTELAFLHPLPVRALWGVGPATGARLARLGIRTVGDLARTPPATVVAAVGKTHGTQLQRLAWAVDDRKVVAGRDPKSIGQEQTYPTDRFERADLGREIVRLADGVGSRLRGAGMAGRTVTLKVRFGDFSTVTRAATVPSSLITSVAVAAVAAALLDGIDISKGVRLLGISVSNLTEQIAEQLALPVATEPREAGPGGAERDGGPGAAASVRRQRDPAAGTPAREWSGATAAVDAIRRRFGTSAVGPAALLGGGARRSGGDRWGPSPGRPA